MGYIFYVYDFKHITECNRIQNVSCFCFHMKYERSNSRDMSDFFLNVMDGRFGIMFICYFAQQCGWRKGLSQHYFPVHMNSHAGRGPWRRQQRRGSCSGETEENDLIPFNSNSKWSACRATGRQQRDRQSGEARRHRDRSTGARRRTHSWPLRAPERGETFPPSLCYLEVEFCFEEVRSGSSRRSVLPIELCTSVNTHSDPAVTLSLHIPACFLLLGTFCTSKLYKMYRVMLTICTLTVSRRVLVFRHHPKQWWRLKMITFHSSVSHSTVSVRNRC